MPIIDVVKNKVRKTIESKPEPDELAAMVKKRKPSTIYFEDDGVTPNHPRWPVIFYRSAITFDRRFDNSAVMDKLFTVNGWGRSWRASIYNFLHYHSSVHEVLGVARGRADIQLGGVKGKTVSINVGDVLILPAGTGHQRIKAAGNFMVVGAYPPDGTYDECTDTRDRQRVKKDIARAKKPATDPVYGNEGELVELWARRLSRKAR